MSLEPDWVLNPDWNPEPSFPRTDGASTSAYTLSHPALTSRGRKRRRSIEDEAEVTSILTSDISEQCDDLEELLRGSMTSSKKRRMTEVEYQGHLAELAEEEGLATAFWEGRSGWKDDSPSGSDSTLVQSRHPDGFTEGHEYPSKSDDTVPVHEAGHIHFETTTSDLESIILVHDGESNADSDDCASNMADRASFARSVSPPPKSCQPTRRPKPAQPPTVSAIPVQAWYIMMADPNGRAYPWVVSRETWDQVAVVIQDSRQQLWNGRTVPWVQPIGPKVTVKEESYD
jgi:hypothetical protein